jgi:U4/U6 small nuclear ribonucleoprotein PRP3
MNNNHDNNHNSNHDNNHNHDTNHNDDDNNNHTNHTNHHVNHNNNNHDDIVINKRRINNLIEHDVPLRAERLEQLKREEIVIPLMLTAQERKKLRKQQRLEREREKQQKIRMGLIPPPPPKATLKNFMKIYVNDATQDPTKLEQKIREEMEQRRKNHELKSAQMKLTPEQRKERKWEKIKKDEQKELLCSVYRLNNYWALSHPQNRFKLNANANELYITGVIIHHDHHHILIVEGGPKSMRKFIHVLQDRVNWKLKPSDAADGATANRSQESDKEEESDEVETPPYQLVWQGVQAKRNFKFFNSIAHKFQDEDAARKYLQDNGDIAHYLDYAK